MGENLPGNFILFCITASFREETKTTLGLLRRVLIQVVDIWFFFIYFKIPKHFIFKLALFKSSYFRFFSDVKISKKKYLKIAKTKKLT